MAGAALLVTGTVTAGPTFARVIDVRTPATAAPGTRDSSAVEGAGNPKAAAPTRKTAAPTRAPGTTARWRNTTAFMEIRGGAVRNGTVHLTVRPAKKRVLGESFETVPVPGPYTEIATVPHARILYLDGESGSPEVFVDTLKARPAKLRVEGFDVHFNAKGAISQVDWLYVP
jgi:hypothetical protein